MVQCLICDCDFAEVQKKFITTPRILIVLLDGSACQRLMMSHSLNLDRCIETEDINAGSTFESRMKKIFNVGETQKEENRSGGEENGNEPGVNEDNSCMHPQRSQKDSEEETDSLSKSFADKDEDSALNKIMNEFDNVSSKMSLTQKFAGDGSISSDDSTTSLDDSDQTTEHICSTNNSDSASVESSLYCNEDLDYIDLAFQYSTPDNRYSKLNYDNGLLGGLDSIDLNARQRPQEKTPISINQSKRDGSSILNKPKVGEVEECISRYIHTFMESNEDDDEILSDSNVASRANVSRVPAAAASSKRTSDRNAVCSQGEVSTAINYKGRLMKKRKCAKALVFDDDPKCVSDLETCVVDDPVPSAAAPKLCKLGRRCKVPLAVHCRREGTERKGEHSNTGHSVSGTSDLKKACTSNSDAAKDRPIDKNGETNTDTGSLESNPTHKPLSYRLSSVIKHSMPELLSRRNGIEQQSSRSIYGCILIYTI